MMIENVSGCVRRQYRYFITINSTPTTKGAGMNIRNFVLAIIMFAAGCLFTATLGSRSLHLSAMSPEPAVAAQATPQKWEYRIVANGGTRGVNAKEVNDALIQLGKEGFNEVVWSNSDGAGGNYTEFHITLLLRRPKP
jgi:hypothetical protein